MSTLNLHRAREIMESGEWVIARTHNATLIFNPIQRVTYSTGALGEEVNKGAIPRIVRNKMIDLGLSPSDFVRLPFRDINKSWRPDSVEIFNLAIEISIDNKKYRII